MNIEHSANFNISTEIMEPDIQQSDEQILNQEIEYDTVNLTNANAKPNSHSSLSINFNVNINKDKESWVWDYFLTEKNEDICKIIGFFKGKEKKCGQKYKHNSGTGNMAYHL
ncbi:10847_t:CDS:2 [Cetraspora pellucida]|uniref:10847_t:CDS:1 n=1 Tax=Cetraspora pellucida TaxID=1433469 RepID=A0ACA9L1F9_9GLOM|nr:10847_t:CDS:2 [Cetraspora pellucida]